MFRLRIRPRLFPKVRLIPRRIPIVKPTSSGFVLGFFIRKLIGVDVIENDYVRVESGNGQLEHRAVAESILGRRLEVGEVVHHINGKRYDNSPGNLCVMSSYNHDRYHAWFDWVHKNYGVYPRRDTQLKKLRESFNGRILSDFQRGWFS